MTQKNSVYSIALLLGLILFSWTAFVLHEVIYSLGIKMRAGSFFFN
jgi:hypothetical protein